MAVHSMDEILNWIAERNHEMQVKIRQIKLAECTPWYYSEQSGCIENAKGSFFSIAGLQQFQDGRLLLEQPIILQQEIGYLGLICRHIKGALHFLIQAKIEPGNVNKIQLSPTIQATKSNFTRQHGGKSPAYLGYFLRATPEQVVVDQLQSEQASRFLGKRNRNIILYLQDEVDALPSHRWLTIEQIRRLLTLPNLVNMDLRTVLSCLPLRHPLLGLRIRDKTVAASLDQGGGSEMAQVYHYLNDYKMFDSRRPQLVPLTELKTWQMDDWQIGCRDKAGFKVIFCDIEIEGREVRRWCQPLFAAVGSAAFGLFTKVEKGSRLFLLKAMPEVGCFDRIELGPSLQKEAGKVAEPVDTVESLFQRRLTLKRGVIYDNFLSEEGGRFYHEENRNIIIEVGENELMEPPEGYFWLSYKTIDRLLAINNCLNIQARNLLALWEW